MGQSLLFIEKTNTEEIFLYKISKEANNEILRNQKLNYALMNAQLLLFLVNDILDFSRNKNNSTLALNLTQFPLQRVLEEVFLMMNMEALNKGISLIIQNECPRNLSLYSDEVRLKQILINLISNSIKFTFKGFVKLKVSSIIPQENLVKFEVIDTGLGIKPEVLPLLMKPFATFDIPDRKINRNGIGLGLYISKTLAGALGPNEELFIYSEEGKGSKFGFVAYIMNEMENNKSLKESIIMMDSIKKEFEKKLESFYEENAIESDTRDFQIKTRNISSQSFYNNKSPFNSYNSIISSHSKNSKISSRKTLNQKFQPYLSKISNSSYESSGIKGNKVHNVLIVDDQVFNLMILYEMLTTYPEMSISVQKATDGLMAVEMFSLHNAPHCFEEDPFELIFMDCEMPLMGGLEAAKLIRKKILVEGFLDLKIIACSGDVEKKEDKEGIGMDDWITKPVNKESIYKFLKKYL